ncbi:serine protease [Bradyrhizobium sp. STM 3809]|uniref:S1 family peptidase n=1 Tax=Bradyrhizobium sp. STM 3809 TaxID=551936 RepID=UPI001F0A69A7|nr:serine protease [Bradyrhizobium sp. STM 3809]
MSFSLGCPAAKATDQPNSLSSLAVVISSPQKVRLGSGIYLGEGLVLTASHVLGDRWQPAPLVWIAGTQLPAKVVKQEPFDSSDLTLLSIDEHGLPREFQTLHIALCEAPPRPGDRVLSISPEQVVATEILSPIWVPPDARKFETLVRDVASTGNSGSGVFDAEAQCLLGIMSRKISQVIPPAKGSGQQPVLFDIAKYFVPAARIAAFLPTGLGHAHR